MKEALVSTLMHVIELLVVLGVALVLIKVLNIESGTMEVVIGLVLASLAKFVRASDLPIQDYVNNR